jgi:hypothetical protein
MFRQQAILFILLGLLSGCASSRYRGLDPLRDGIAFLMYQRGGAAVISAFEQCLAASGVSAEDRDDAKIEGTFNAVFGTQPVYNDDLKRTISIPTVEQISFSSDSLNPKTKQQVDKCLSEKLAAVKVAAKKMFSASTNWVMSEVIAGIDSYPKAHPDVPRELRGNFFPYSSVQEISKSGVATDMVVQVERVQDIVKKSSICEARYHPNNLDESRWWSNDKYFTNMWKMPVTWTEDPPHAIKNDAFKPSTWIK